MVDFQEWIYDNGAIYKNMVSVVKSTDAVMLRRKSERELVIDNKINLPVPTPDLKDWDEALNKIKIMSKHNSNDKRNLVRYQAVIDFMKFEQEYDVHKNNFYINVKE